MTKEIRLSDGSIYIGEYIDNNGFYELTGLGKISYPNGNKYIGEFKDGNLSGHGTYYFNDGEEHCGVFKYGIPNGVGMHQYTSGAVYIGGFRNGKRGGYGLYCFPNGKIDFGVWVNNILIEDMTWHTRVVTQMATSGVGIAQMQNNQGFYFGEEAFNNNPVLGIIFYPNEEVYIGKIKGGKRNGNGKLFQKDNKIKDGIWHNNIQLDDF